MGKIKGSNLEFENVSKINTIPVDEFGGGGGEEQNYLTDGKNAETTADLTPWTIYKDVAGNNPVDGLGGSPGITWTRNTINPLSGLGDFLLTKDGSDRQGEGVSIPFTIENRHLAKMMRIECDAELRSGIFNNPLFNAQATYSVTSNVCTVTLPNSFTAFSRVTVIFETGGAVSLSNTFALTGATSSTFTFLLVTGNTSGNCRVFFVGSVRLTIIGDPSGTPFIEEPVGTQLQLGVVGQKVRFYATFQTHISVKNYRLCVHISGATTNAFSIGFNNFVIWEQTKNFGTGPTEWQPYTPTFVNMGTSPSSLLWWRRNGANLEIKGDVTTGSSLPTAVGGFSTPNGLTFSSAICSTRQRVGLMIRSTGSINQVNVLALAPESIFYFSGGDGSAINTGLTPQNINSIVDPSARHSVDISVPIQGWGSSMALSSQAGDGRLVACRYFSQPSQSTSTTVPLQWTNRDYDTHNAVTIGTVSTANAWRFTAPQSGYYSIKAGLYGDTVTNINYRLRKNGIFVGIFGFTPPGNWGSGSGSLYLNTGDYIDITTNSSASILSVTDTYIAIEQINSGSQILARDEFVGASYYSSATQTSLTTQINFGVRVYDTHGAVTTGASWRFTAPVSGRYRVTFRLGGSSNIHFIIYKNGTLFRYIARTETPGYATGSREIELLAGEFLDIRPLSSSTVNGNADPANVDASSIEISRIG